MKSVLISIQPKWCELIASGKKTVEIRKSKPKLNVPFKVYIYETKGKLRWCNKCQETDCERPYPNCACWEGHGKVIGEFVCDAIFPMSILYSNPNDRLAQREFPFTCLTDKQIMDYLGNGGEGYGWHISDLVIYDKPRELSESYDHVEKTKDELLAERARLTEENERLRVDLDNARADTLLEYGEKVYHLILGFVGEKLSEQDKDYITVRLGQIAKEMLEGEK